MDSKDEYAILDRARLLLAPLAMEKEAVLDKYFNDITVHRIESEEEGSSKIDDKPMLWKKV
jgi:hypothetical protein